MAYLVIGIGFIVLEVVAAVRMRQGTRRRIPEVGRGKRILERKRGAQMKETRCPFLETKTVMFCKAFRRR